MYINDIHLGYYIGFIILGIFVGEFVSWMNKRLPEYKKVFSKDICWHMIGHLQMNTKFNLSQIIF